MEISNKQKPRDYDKEPLVINGYEKFFAITWYLVLLFSVLTIAIIEDFMECGSLCSPKGVVMNLVMLGILIAICIFKLIRSKQQIRFTDRYIEFIENGVVKRFCKVEFDELRRSFSIDIFISSKISRNICNLSLTIMGLIALKWKLLEIIFFIYLWGFFLNFIFYLSMNKNLKGFSAMPFIRVAEYTTNPGYHNILPRYYLIYIYNDKIYNDIKEYFLQKNIDIDYIKKNYLFV